MASSSVKSVTAETGDVHLFMESCEQANGDRGFRMLHFSHRSTPDLRETTFTFAYEYVFWQNLHVVIAPKHASTVLGASAVLLLEYDKTGEPTESEVKNTDATFDVDHVMHVRQWLLPYISSPCGAFVVTVRRREQAASSSSSRSSSSAHAVSTSVPPPLEKEEETWVPRVKKQ